jgi:cyclopropane-fatty-acyl-phospholipid synthase
MLGPTMVYSCAYFASADDTLDAAQTRKLDLVCRKLELRPGLRLLDIGCGWGNLAHHAAAHYGVRVVGLTVSEAQAEYARQYCAGLPVEIRFGDYRHLQERFDRVAAIEMIEAVGRKNLRGFFATVDRVLEPGGLFLLQAITAETFSPRSRPDLDLFVLWLERHIFPNGYLPKVTELADPCRDRFTLLDWHDFGDCYERTLMAWAARFDGGFATLAGRYGEAFRRRWDYYLHGCAAAFRAGPGAYRRVTHPFETIPVAPASLSVCPLSPGAITTCSGEESQ